MKKLFSFILALVMALGCSAAVYAEPSMDAIVFTGDEISLDLDTVVHQIMTSGSGIELVEIRKLSDKAIAEGYADSYQTLKNTMDMMNKMPFATVAAMGMRSEDTR